MQGTAFYAALWAAALVGLLMGKLVFTAPRRTEIRERQIFECPCACKPVCRCCGCAKPEEP